MKPRTLQAVALLTALAFGGLQAQVELGSKAPVPEADRILKGSVKSLGELKGRLVVYEFFAHW